VSSVVAPYGAQEFEMARLWTFGDERYRTIDESGIVELFLIFGWAIEQRTGGRVDAEVQARAALDRLVGLGLQHRRSERGGRLFDPVEALNFLHWAGLHRDEPTFRDRCVATERQLVAQDLLSRDTSVDPPAKLEPQRYAVIIRRTFNLAGVRPGQRVRFRLPLPLEDPASSDIQVEFLPPPDLEVDTVVAPGRLDALAIAPGGGLIAVGVKIAFTASPGIPGRAGSTLNSDQARIYTRASEGLVKVSERVATLAADLAGAGTDVWGVIRRFWDFMLDDVALGAIHYDQLDAERPLDTVLDQGWYDCHVGSALFVALCRARGIPARVVRGYVMHEFAPSFHSWLEAWIDDVGWVPFDLSSWGLSEGGEDAAWRHCYFGQIDHRMVVERPPFLFSGTGTLRLPPAWHMLIAADGAGSRFEFRARDSGALVYSEYIEVQRNV
jgi:hypothetical protein